MPQQKPKTKTARLPKSKKDAVAIRLIPLTVRHCFKKVQSDKLLPGIFSLNNIPA
jgi:hypothetical protein